MNCRPCRFALVTALLSAGLAAIRVQAGGAQTLPKASLVTSDVVVPLATEDKSLLAQLTKPTGPSGVSIAGFMAKGATTTPEAVKEIPVIFADLVRYLRGNPSAVINEVKTLGDRYDLIVKAAQNGDPTAERTLLSALVLDRLSSNKLVDSLKVLDASIGKDAHAAEQVASDMTDARRLITQFTGDQILAALFAQGAVRNGLSGSASTATAGTGSIGLALSKRDWQLAGLVTVASSVDTLRSGFGSFLLSPASGKSSLSTFLVDLHTPPVARIWSKGELSPLWPAAHVYVAGSNSTWERRIISPSLVDTARSYKQAAVLGLGVLANWRIVRGRLLNVPIQINVETGYSRRYLRGDIFADTAFIRGTLQSPESSVRKSWGAWESGFQMAIGAVTAGVQYYWIDGNNDRSFISGLTSGQLIIGIAVAGDVVSGVLSRQ
jgi:hypothetical protein